MLSCVITRNTKMRIFTKIIFFMLLYGWGLMSSFGRGITQGFQKCISLGKRTAPWSLSNCHSSTANNKMTESLTDITSPQFKFFPPYVDKTIIVSYLSFMPTDRLSSIPKLSTNKYSLEFLEVEGFLVGKSPTPLGA